MLLWVYAEMLIQSYDYAISYFNHNFYSSDADASYINMSLVKKYTNPSGKSITKCHDGSESSNELTAVL